MRMRDFPVPGISEYKVIQHTGNFLQQVLPMFVSSSEIFPPPLFTVLPKCHSDDVTLPGWTPQTKTLIEKIGDTNVTFCLDPSHCETILLEPVQE